MHGYHVTVKPDPQTEATLAEFYSDYTHRRFETQERWLPWIQEHFNAGDQSRSRAEGKPTYTLQLVQRWDATKLTIYGSVPILLSLAVGFWYQATVEGDRATVAQTAWTIASFIIGAAGLAIAMLAAITQLYDL